MNEQLLLPVLGKLLELGLPGLVIAYFIWRSRNLEIEIGKRDERIAELQEKRIIESGETVRTLGKNEFSNDKVGSALSSLSERLTRLVELLDRLERERNK